MILSDFLMSHSLHAVELLPDSRLINVIVEQGELFGVIVNDIPTNSHITRLEPVVYENNIISVNGLTFDATEYTLLANDNIVA